MEREKKTVWAVAISAVMPMEKNFNWIKQVSLNEISKINLQEFVAEVNDEALNEN